MSIHGDFSGQKVVALLFKIPHNLSNLIKLQFITLNSGFPSSHPALPVPPFHNNKSMIGPERRELRAVRYQLAWWMVISLVFVLT